MIEFHNVWKSFGTKPVLQGVELTVQDGETFFVLGKTGAGKTVMIRLLVGLLKAERGEIRLDGEEITNYTEDQFQAVRRKCGMVFQLPTLLDSFTVFENVSFGLRRQGEILEEELTARVEKALRQVELPLELARRMPAELSFGEQKRVGLARTTVLSPRYLLYDEPTTGLDPFTANRISLLIRGLNRELSATAIVVSHDLTSMALTADRVGLLAEGKLVFVGTVPEFIRSSHPQVLEFKKSWTAPTEK